MFKLQSPSKYSPLDAIHLIEIFFHCSQQFLNSSILMSFSASAIFCFTSSTSAKHFPLRTFFIPGNKQKNKVTRGGIRWTLMPPEGGTQQSGHFLSKTAEHSAWCAHKSPLMKWANALKESSIKFHWSLSHHQLVHWYRWVLEHSPTGRTLHLNKSALQKIIRSYFECPFVYEKLSQRDPCFYFNLFFTYFIVFFKRYSFLIFCCLWWRCSWW